MKSKILTLFAISFFSFTVVIGQSRPKQINPVGTWKFEAPYAPEGYTSGTIVFGKAEQKTTASVSFTGSDYKIEGEKVKTPNDSIFFSVYLEGQDIKISMKIENETKITGKAIYSDGEIPLTLTKSLEVNK